MCSQFKVWRRLTCSKTMEMYSTSRHQKVSFIIHLHQGWTLNLKKFPLFFNSTCRCVSQHIRHIRHRTCEGTHRARAWYSQPTRTRLVGFPSQTRRVLSSCPARSAETTNGNTGGRGWWRRSWSCWELWCWSREGHKPWLKKKRWQTGEGVYCDWFGGPEVLLLPCFVTLSSRIDTVSALRLRFF